MGSFYLWDIINKTAMDICVKAWVEMCSLLSTDHLLARVHPFGLDRSRYLSIWVSTNKVSVDSSSPLYGLHLPDTLYRLTLWLLKQNSQLQIKRRSFSMSFPLLPILNPKSRDSLYSTMDLNNTQSAHHPAVCLSVTVITLLIVK